MNKEELLKLKEELTKLSSEEEKMRDLYLRGLANGKIEGPLVGYPTIDKPWLKYFSSDKIIEDVPEMSIFQLAYLSNITNLDNVALDMRSSMNDFNKGIKITYKTFFEKVYELAKSMKTMNVKVDEIIPFILPNVAEARYLIYASSLIGSTTYPISPLLPQEQLEMILKNENVKTIFIFEAFFPKYEEALKNSNLENIVLLNGLESMPKIIKMIKSKENKSIHDINKAIFNWDEYCNIGKNYKENITPYYRKDHIAAIIGTSGTTGLPKGVCLTDKNINAVAIAYKNGEYFTGDFLDALLPSIGYGISMIHYQMVDNRYVYLIPELLSDKFPRAVVKLKPDNFPGGPIHYINLVNSSEFKNNALPYMANFISGGATLSSDVEQRLNGVTRGYAENGIINNDIIVRQGYGLSENTAMGSYNKRGSYAFGSIGIPIIYETVGIFMPDTDIELPYGESGEICITGDAVMKEYLKNKEETDKVIKIHSDGKRWIHTKDIGYMDNNGHLFHVDRIKNIFMRYGFNVHPTKISEFINSIPFVKNSAVIGFEHKKEQTVPVAFIELNEDMDQVNLSELKEELYKICMNNLEEPSVPFDFIFVDQLPINVGGKINNILLKEKSQIDLMNNDEVYCRKLYFKES